MWLVPFGNRKTDRAVARDPFLSLFDEFLNNSFSSSLGVNYAANGESYVFSVPVPGADPKDVEVEVNDGMVFVKATTSTEEGERTLRSSFAIPEDADPEKIDANVKNGLLRIRIDRHEASKPRKITVH